ncbi:MAG TPA: GNAT family protein [Anaeromyxobacter sp.]
MRRARKARRAGGAPRTARPLGLGPRVLIRRVTRGDRAELLAMNRASRAFHHPWAFPPDTPAAFERYAARFASPDFVQLAVCRREDGAIAGIVNVSHIVRGALRSAYLGYYGNAALAGRGLMAEGLSLVVRHCFGPLGLHRVEANIQPGNRASRILVRRLGFTREGFSRRYLEIGGRWRDHERWALLEEYFRARGPTGGRERRPRVRGASSERRAREVPPRVRRASSPARGPASRP